MLYSYHVHLFYSVQPHATTLSCNAVLDLVLIKVGPVTIAHMTAIPTMMKVIALVSCNTTALCTPFVHHSAYYVNNNSITIMYV